MPDVEQLARTVGTARARRRTSSVPPDALVTSRGRGSATRSVLPARGSAELTRIARRAARRRLLTIRAESLCETTALAVGWLAERGTPLWLDVPESGLTHVDRGIASVASVPPDADDGDLGRYVRSTRLARAAGVEPRASVSVLLASRRPAMLEHALAQLRAQQDVDMQLVIGLHGTWPDAAEQRAAELWPGELVTVRAPETTTLGGLLRTMTDRADGSLVTKWDDDDWYGRHHVGDLVRDHAASGAHLVGKAAEFVWLEAIGETIRRSGLSARTYSSNLAGGTLLMSRSELLAVGGFPDAPRSVDRILIDTVRARGGIVYRTHGLEFVLRRSAASEHTWNPELQYFLDDAIDRRTGLDLRFADITAPDAEGPA